MKKLFLLLALISATAFAAQVGKPFYSPEGREVIMIDAFAYNGQYNVKATGYQATVACDGDHNIDFAVGAEDRYIQGVRLLLKNQHWGDNLDLQVIDKDNVLGLGANTILNQFATGWNVDSETQDQGQTAFSYVARLPAGVYIRLVYHGSCALLDPDVKLLVNFLLHKKVA